MFSLWWLITCPHVIVYCVVSGVIMWSLYEQIHMTFMHGAESLRRWLSPCWSVNSLVLWNLKIHYFAFIVCHWNLSWVKWIHSTSTFQLFYRLPFSGRVSQLVFPFRFCDWHFYAFLTPPMCTMCTIHLSILDFTSLIISLLGTVKHNK